MYPLPGLLLTDAWLSAERDLHGVKACRKMMKLVFRHLGGDPKVSPLHPTENAGALMEASRVANRFLTDHCRRCGLCDLSER